MNNIVKWFHEIDKPLQVSYISVQSLLCRLFVLQYHNRKYYFVFYYIFNFSIFLQQLKVYVFNKQLFNYSKLKARSMLLSFNTRNLFDRKVQKLFGVKAVF